MSVKCLCASTPCKSISKANKIGFEKAANNKSSAILRDQVFRLIQVISCYCHKISLFDWQLFMYRHPDKVWQWTISLEADQLPPWHTGSKASHGRSLRISEIYLQNLGVLSFSPQVQISQTTMWKNPFLVLLRDMTEKKGLRRGLIFLSHL